MSNQTPAASVNVPREPCRLSRGIALKWRTILLLALIVIIYLAGVTDRWWPTNDSALYLGLARSIYQGHGYQFNGEFNATVTPGLPLMLAGVHVLFAEGFWFCNLLMAMCGLAALAMIYLVLSLLASRRLAVYVVIVTAMSYTFYMHSHRILTDIPFMLLFWAMLYAGIRYQHHSRWWLGLTGLLIVLCIVVRAPGLLLIGPAVLGLAIDCTSKARWTKRLALTGVIILAAVLTAGAFCIYAQLTTQQEPYYAKLFLNTLSQDPSRHLKGLIQGLLKMPTVLAQLLFSQAGLVFREVALGALLLAIIGAVNLWRRGQRLVTVLVIVYPLVLIVSRGEAAAMQQRYIMPVYPLLFYAVIEGVCLCAGKIRRQLRIAEHPEVPRRILRILAIVVIACNSPRLVREAFYYSYLSHTPRFYEVIRSGKYAELSDVVQKLQTGPDDGLVGVMGGKLRIVHFLTGRRIVSLDGEDQRPIRKSDTLLDAVTSHPALQAIVFVIQGESPDLLDRLELVMSDADMAVVHRGKRFLAWKKLRPEKSNQPISQGVTDQ